MRPTDAQFLKEQSEQVFGDADSDGGSPGVAEAYQEGIRGRRKRVMRGHRLTSHMRGKEQTGISKIY